MSPLPPDDRPPPSYVFWLDHVKLLIEKETGVILERIDARDIAQRLQAKELERRLDNLNHAHAKAAEDRNEFVKREVYDPFRDEVKDWLAERKGGDRWATVAVGIGASLLTLAVAHFLGVR